MSGGRRGTARIRGSDIVRDPSPDVCRGERPSETVTVHALIALVALAIVGTACGGAGPNKNDYVRPAAEKCHRHTPQLPAPPRTGRPPSPGAAPKHQMTQPATE